MALECAVVGHGLKIKVADPQTTVALGSVFIYSLHTLAESVEAHPVDIGYDRVNRCRERFGRGGGRRGGLAGHVMDIKLIVRRIGKQLYFHVSE